MNTISVSVVIPCFNALDTLNRCLVSITKQTALPREVILVDDGSDIPIEPFLHDIIGSMPFPVRVLRQVNRGAPAARNAGIKLAQGKYIAFLDADDVWLPEKLQVQFDIMEQEGLILSGHDYVFDASALPGEGSSRTEGVQVRQIHKWRFAYGNPFFTPTVMVRKDRFTGFDERFRRVDDYKAWLEHFQPSGYARIGLTLAAGFKPAIGHSGLTASFDLMHEGYVDVLRALRKEGQIGWLFFSAAWLCEAIKFPVRKHKARLVK
jgi:glycosyltransferase involved in cell wall biosynthesis